MAAAIPRPLNGYSWGQEDEPLASPKSVDGRFPFDSVQRANSQDLVVLNTNLSDGVDRRSWKKNMIRQGLGKEAVGDYEEEPQDATWGWSQGVLLLAMILTSAAVLFCNVLSKFSFITLVREMYEARHDNMNDTRASTAFVMLVVIIMIPQFGTFLLCLWQSCYSAKGNNPWPKLTSWKFNVLQAILEVLGLCTFVFVVAPRLDGAVVLSILPAVFSTFGLLRVWSIYREHRPGYDQYGFVPARDEELEPMAGHHVGSRAFRIIRRMSWFEIFAYVVAFVLQLPLPFYLYLMDTELWLCGATFAASICLSIAWLPILHKKIRSCNESVLRNRARYLPSLPKTGRVWAYLFNSAMRIVLTIVYATVYVHLDPSFTFTSVPAAFGQIGSSSQLVPFLVQLFSSFCGYQAARLACLLTMQRYSFALPLFSSTPVALLVFMLWTRFPYFDLPSNSVERPYLLIICNLLFWVSEGILLFRAAWNTKTPRLALDDALFIQPAYNPIFLEQFSLVNRRAPMVFQSEDVSEPMASPEEELQRSVIYICTTMYREDEEEMRQVLKSLIELSPELGNVCEAHVFMDGGANGEILQQYALQLINCFLEELTHAQERFGQPISEDYVKSGKRIVTPYGIRLEWLLPNHNMPFIVHLKDGNKVKNKKRWSQILYMYYFLQFRFPADGGPMEMGYILATDADVRFGPADVKALHTLLSRDKRVGAVCGRTYPIGTGPLVWYQMFDYAIGHWFQKAAEHVLGSVLCCPGCFSLYRLDALRSTLQTYGTGVDKAFDFLIKDMGEDRWLCTLLVQEGWRLDYTATACDYTHCPTEFKEFFNQRRRWIMSTLANIISLLQNYKKATTNNNSISFLFIVYQGLMLFSTVISPATVLLVVIGGMHYATDLSVTVLSGITVSLAGIFLLICMAGASQDNQIFAAKIFTLIFAFIMGAVFVGVASEIASEFHQPDSTGSTVSPVTTTSTIFFHANLTETIVATVAHALGAPMGGTGQEGLIPDTMISISTLYLGSIIGMFLIAGVLHANEAKDLVHGIWYLLCLPGGYLFLIIYSFCNLNDRSWGTREEAAKKNSAGTSGLGEILLGCGRYPNESLFKFFGRALCCRAGVPPPPPEVVNPYSLIVDAPKKDEKPVWRIQYHSSDPGCNTFRAICEPIEELSRLLRGIQVPVSAADLARVVELTQKALKACPEIGSGPCGRYWDKSSNSFRVQPGESANDLPFRAALMEEIREIAERRVGELSPIVSPRDDLSKPLDEFLRGIGVSTQFLQSIGVNNEFVYQRLLENGYDDDTFFDGLKDDDLRAMGFHELMNGRALVKRLLDASTSGKLKLQRPVVPTLIPTTMRDWLVYLHLERYERNLQMMGYGERDLVLLENLSDREIEALGIIKRAHIKKFKAGLKKLGELLSLGRTPEGPTKETTQRQVTRESVQQMELVTLDRSLLVSRHTRDHEVDFWNQIVDDLLDSKLDLIENVANLKSDLEKLKNTAVLSLVVLNALWMTVMLVFASASASSLNVIGTNPLGLVFLMLFGFLFFLQFLSMLWHRNNALVEYVANVEVPWKAADPRQGRTETDYEEPEMA